MANRKKKEIKKYPEAIVGALITRKDGKILLAKNLKYGGKYTIIGGHVEYGERAEDAVVREVKEEAGLDVKVLAKFIFSESIFNKNFYKKKHFIFLDFLCYCKNYKKVKLNEEYENDFIWVTLKEAKKMDMGGGTRGIIKKFEDYNKIHKTRSKIKRVKQKNGKKSTK